MGACFQLYLGCHALLSFGQLVYRPNGSIFNFFNINFQFLSESTCSDVDDDF